MTWCLSEIEVEVDAMARTRTGQAGEGTRNKDMNISTGRFEA